MRMLPHRRWSGVSLLHGGSDRRSDRIPVEHRPRPIAVDSVSEYVHGWLNGGINGAPIAGLSATAIFA